MKWALVLVAAGCFSKPAQPSATPGDATQDVSIDTPMLMGRHWTQPAYAPGPAVSDPSLAYDSGHNQVLLYGGEEQFQAVYNDSLFKLTATGWQQLCSGCAPGARTAAAFAYDPARQVAVLVGGFLGTGFADTAFWEWNGTDWTQKPVTLPTARGACQLVFDPVRGKLVLIGGVDNTTALKETYTYDGTSLVRLADAPDIINDGIYQAGCDANNQRVIVAGGDGFDISSSGDAIYALGSTATSWSTVCSSCGAPRSAHNLVYDPLLQHAWMFGGNVNGGAIVDGTWSLTTNQWVAADAMPPGRDGAATVYDAGRDVFVRYGGYNSSCPTSNGNCDDTWEMVPN